MLWRSSIITLSLSHSVLGSHKDCLKFLEHSSMVPPQAYVLDVFSDWNFLPPGFYMVCSITSFKSLFSCHLHSESYLDDFTLKFITHSQNPPSPFHTLFSPTHLSPSNIHDIWVFPYFGYCLIFFLCQNVSSMRARIFVCLVHYYVPSACNCTWYVVGTQ